jgi:hypothetical protein
VKSTLTLVCFVALIGCTTQAQQPTPAAPSPQAQCRQAGLTPGSDRFLACVADLDVQAKGREQRCLDVAQREQGLRNPNVSARVAMEQLQESFRKCMAQ